MKTFKKLDELKVKNAFIGKPFDFGINNSNRKKEISKILKVDESKVFYSFQNHTNKVEIVEEEDKIDDEKFVNNDGLITNIKGITLLSYVADCQGILLYDPAKKVIGNVHSGWKGTANKIVVTAIDKMVKEFNSKKGDILCFISPSIHACHFEIEDDVLNYFMERMNVDSFIVDKKTIEFRNKYYLDLIELNKKILIDCGIKKENIYVMDECTVCNDNYHSYRRDKTNERNGLIISL